MLSTWLLVCDQITVILISVYLKFVSNNWLYLQIFGLSLNVIAVIGLFLIPESPEYLYFFYKFREAKKVIRYIADFNKSKDLEVRYQFDTEYDMKVLRHVITKPSI